MTNFPREWRRPVATAMALALAGSLVSCFNPFDPKVVGVGVSDPPPVPDSPGNALRLLEWCYEQRQISEYRELFTEDYRFVFGQLDPDGIAYRDNPWTREDELESTDNLFQGGDANQPVATSITILFDRNFIVEPDPTFPASSRWRKWIRTSVLLKLVDANSLQRESGGYANFFLVRGDSALIPPELVSRGFLPDSNRWYIRRHEDDTISEQEEGLALGPSEFRNHATGTRSIVSPVAAMPASYQRLSWGALKHRYR